jgi:neutral ceramidase
MDRILRRNASYHVGTATACITPEEPLWLAGYASRTSPARGIISDLYATALALEDEQGSRLVIASMDLIAITPVLADPAIETVRRRHGLSREQILLSATHTHYGPEFRPDKKVFFRIPDDFAGKFAAVGERLTAALVEVIDQAWNSLRPARLFARSTTVGFAKNRRQASIQGKSIVPAAVDHDVNVLECVGEDGRRKAIVFGYACHNTTIPPDDLRYCGDWAGFAKEQLHRDNPEATVLFLPGAGADQEPEPRGSVELSRQHGLQMAHAVQETLKWPGEELIGPLSVNSEKIILPLEPVTQDSISRMLKGDDPPQQVKARYLAEMQARGDALITSYSAPIQIVRFGNRLLLIALSGEPVVDWAHRFKDMLSKRRGFPPTAASEGIELLETGPTVWVAGYCNDMFGYLPTRRVQTEGGYEGGRAALWSWIPAPFADGVEECVMDAVLRLVNRANK